jgi:hypothetical protein
MTILDNSVITHQQPEPIFGLMDAAAEPIQVQAALEVHQTSTQIL